MDDCNHPVEALKHVGDELRCRKCKAVVAKKKVP